MNKTKRSLKEMIRDAEGGTNPPLFNMIIVIAKVKAILDRRESFVLRETLSYLYMVTNDEENAIHHYLDYPRIQSR